MAVCFAPVWWPEDTGRAPCTVTPALAETADTALTAGWQYSRLLRWPYTGFVAALPEAALMRPVPLPTGGLAWLLDAAILPQWRVLGTWPTTT